jgi:glycosyltransferase involved in cell wall biosynthesis
MRVNSVPGLSPGNGVRGRTSIIVPCHDQSHFLGSALESALEQTYDDVEVIVVDDGSRDNTEEVARRFGVRVVRRPNGGLAAARNSGAVASTGEYLTFLDADDRLLPHAVSTGIAELERRKEIALVFGHHRLVTYDGSFLAEWLPEPEPRDPYEALLRGNTVKMHATVAYRRRTLERVGLFDLTLPACEDYDLYLRVARKLSIGSYPAVVAEYRRHAANMSNEPARMLSAVLRVLDRQKPWVRGRPELRRAYLEGRHEWLRYYGTPLVDHTRRSVASREWRQLIGNGRALLRWYPAGARRLANDMIRELEAR